MARFEDGDKVYLFGFSRGAFTVRSLAGMLHKCGLLRPDNDSLIEYASKIYNTKGNDEIAAGFKDTFSRSCPVHFIGVWDTVESLVMNAGKKFHDPRLNPEVKFGYHALAIDEKRRDFPPYLWDETRATQGQTIEQVWFVGVHSDVRGWYKECGLSNIALRWMLGKASDAGLQIDEERMAAFATNPHAEKHESYSGFWKFRGSRVRKIPQGSRVHRRVAQRMKKPGNRYSPKNLPENYTLVD